ncbi:hypothetical protein TVAG_076690 [Trichomonas vaginalis G3]|uniref:Uncharacterized protein n=1 Tax=Trichomonas vaginalis (strain ATCC PRA-98 / G3) TaxID=412133 RepID=A2D9R6_TRIV3|nr:hypothetical protein TVAGG3_0292110 [Trichomonas vaginalis G3]EAY22922.1 hypothetical protein TVAG_076690 [Trichomonas vaginalis G3]KAI5527352.1 hypothetical protein TVAGG3_0292110 [Trichomonas vaginalis G3]|eukprot:XP_001583908.1 hypothetical protein [Trichomonas vaginalis G3]
MFNPHKADKADKGIRAICREAKDAEQRLRNEIQNSEYVKNQIFNKKMTLQRLTDQFEGIESESKQYRDQVNELNHRKEFLQKQNSMLNQLIQNVITDTKRKSGRSQFELSQEDRDLISSSINQFYKNLDFECEPVNIDEMKKELVSVKAQQKTLQNEIEILKRISGQWDPVDDLSIEVEDFVQKISLEPEIVPKQPMSERISIPQDPSLLETSHHVHRSSVNHTPEVIEQVEKEIEKRNVLLNENQQIYNQQINSLQKIIDLSNNYNLRQNQSRKFADNELLSISDSEEEVDVYPITIPQIQQHADSSTAFLNEYTDLLTNLTNSLPKPTLFNDCIATVQQNLSIPDVKITEPIVDRFTQASPDLAKLSVELQSLQKLPRDMIDTMSNVPTIPTNQDINSDDLEKETLTLEPIDNRAVDALLTQVEKISPDLSNPLKEIIEKSDTEIFHELEQPEIIEIEPSNADQINKFNAMLSDIISIDFPDESQLPIPSHSQDSQVINVKPVNIPMITNTVCQYLNPSQQNVEFLEKEIIEIRKRLKLVDYQLNSIEDVELEVSDDEIKRLDEEMQRLQKILDEDLSLFTEKRSIYSRIKTEKDNVQKELNSLEAPDMNQLEELEQEVGRKQREYEARKQKADEEIQQFRDLRSMMKMKKT